MTPVVTHSMLIKDKEDTMTKQGTWQQFVEKKLPERKKKKGEGCCYCRMPDKAVVKT